uniref:Uncharacterized protein n=1 Tax=Palpitomonas bilix TaxID=652834 RepID=A0A7S3D2R9_9EUKA|mmetsp:Transcript_19560/g.50122  ORF Transcript_19560/g.50122 Transcript_19560/m.50122 type:complete len:268 (+) Transcript_19560:174-977(+)
MKQVGQFMASVLCRMEGRLCQTVKNMSWRPTSCSWSRAGFSGLSSPPLRTFSVRGPAHSGNHIQSNKGGVDKVAAVEAKQDEGLSKMEDATLKMWTLFLSHENNYLSWTRNGTLACAVATAMASQKQVIAGAGIAAAGFFGVGSVFFLVGTVQYAFTAAAIRYSLDRLVRSAVKEVKASEERRLAAVQRALANPTKKIGSLPTGAYIFGHSLSTRVRYLLLKYGPVWMGTHALFSVSIWVGSVFLFLQAIKEESTEEETAKSDTAKT